VVSGVRIDLNADLGEGVGDDEAMLAIVSSASIATGAHAGGGTVLARAVAAAAEHEVAIGAHPSYRDRAGFGRASHLAVLHHDPSARSHLVADLVHQILLVAREAERHGRDLAHVKAHGSLYNEAVRDAIAAQVVAEAGLGAAAALGYGIAVMTQPGGELARIAADRGMVVICEGFADRGYLRTGQLVPREHPGAVHEAVDVMVAQALDLADGHVRPVDGERIGVAVDSLCVHGDTPGAVAAARAIRAALEARGWQVAPAGQLGAVSPRARGADAGSADSGLAAPPAQRPGDRAGGDPDGHVRVRPYGDRAILLDSADRPMPGTAWVLQLAGRARGVWPRATVVPGLASVLVAFERPSDRPTGHPGALIAALVAGDLTDDADPRTALHPMRSHRIETRYDGLDLADVARILGLPAFEVVRRHRAATWTVAALGFSPGFGYLTTPDPLFAEVGRRADPRRRVPAGSVALAAGMCAVYPSPTPGGWQLIGSTTATLFDSEVEPPSLLGVGDLVQFVEVP
jgi:5-oxoprolinase (ATP-hydrolysing) subunit A